MKRRNFLKTLAGALLAPVLCHALTAKTVRYARTGSPLSQEKLYEVNPAWKNASYEVTTIMHRDAHRLADLIEQKMKERPGWAFVLNPQPLRFEFTSQ